MYVTLNKENEERKIREIAEMKKNVAVFNAQYLWEEIPIKYDEASETYFDTPVFLNIYYETFEEGSTKTNKLKIGEVLVNLGKLLNSKTYRISKQYTVEKCYDSNAKLKLVIDLAYLFDSESKYKVKQLFGSSAPCEPNIFKMSKMREKMNEQEKTMLQNKLFEYQDKLQKHRDLHIEQLKKLSEQIDRKEEKIAQLLSENSVLNQSMQTMQLQTERCKSKMNGIEKDNLQLQQNIKQISAEKNALSNKLMVVQCELEAVNSKLSQIEQTKDKKQTYFKQQLDKYTQKYVDSENNRNKIVFELQSKLKEELLKKDEHYGQLISKLEGKVQSNGHALKELTTKKEKEISALAEKSEKMEREKGGLTMQIRQGEEEKQQLLNVKLSLEELNAQLTAKIKSIESEYEMCAFSNANHSRELQRVKLQCKAHMKTIEEVRCEIELANTTIEEQQQSIVKLNREIQTHRERQFYMEEKFQDELQTQTCNEERIRGSNNYFKGELTKMQMKVKFLEEKVEDGETSVANIGREKEKLQNEMKNANKAIFENSHQMLRAQSDNKKLIGKCEQLQLQCNQKDSYIKQLQSKMQNGAKEKEQQAHSYAVAISKLQNHIKQLSQKGAEEAKQRMAQLQNECEIKNGLFAQLQAELERLRNSELSLKQKVANTEQRQTEAEKELKSERDKTRNLQRESMKTKFEVTRFTQEREQLNGELCKSREEINELQSQLKDSKNESKKLVKALSKQKDAYTEVIRWTLARNWGCSSRQYIEKAGNEVEVELIATINAELERIYSEWEKNVRTIEQLTEQSASLKAQLSQCKQQLQHSSQPKTEPMVFNFPSIHKTLESNTNNPMKQTFNDTYEQSKCEEYKTLNSELQREINMKKSEIESLNEELTEERNKVEECHSELRKVKDEVEDLNRLVKKKNTAINNLQMQLSEGDALNNGAILSSQSIKMAENYKRKSENRSFEQRSSMSLHNRVQQFDRQNSFLKSKIELLQGKLKSTGNEAKKLSTLEKTLKDKEHCLRKINKEYEQVVYCLDRNMRELEVALSNVSSKENYIEELQSQVGRQKKIILDLSEEVQVGKLKLTQREKQLEKASKQTQKTLMENEQNLSAQKMQKEHLHLQQTSQIATLRNNLKEAEGRIGALDGQLKRAKQQNDELHQKNLQLLEKLHKSEESTKDLLMNESVTKHKHEREISDLRERVQTKQFQLQQLKFASESKIMQLEKQLQPRKR